MKGTSKVIMGATLVMVVTLAVVLGLILVLLAELYCSLLLRRRQLRNTNSNTIPTATTQTTTTTTIDNASSPSHEPNPQQHSPPPPPPFSTIYSQGVLQAPRSFLYPSVSCTEKKPNHHSELHDKVIEIQTQESNASPLVSFLSRAPPKPVQEEEDTLQGSSGDHHFVYISNPIYENEEGRTSDANNTPFETPDTSPSRLERSGSSGDDDDAHSPTYTPPLTPMKKLPTEACSVSLKDATSLNTSGSDSHSINGLSSSSSGSPCTSPSW
ncbi:endochitinase A [Gastrolobium bilobum]|uniref:endochitinase A n=1 Tax=Gastrolobium bilobum TaxID=150636 RepID=UPI002AAF3A90|nr:endochitinase A [Gastrolobium bilobum]